MKITQEVRDFARNNPQPFVRSDVEGHTPLPEQGGAGGGSNAVNGTTSPEEAEQGMGQMSRRFEESGGEIYVPAERDPG
jgi:hypothetical protein